MWEYMLISAWALRNRNKYICAYSSILLITIIDKSIENGIIKISKGFAVLMKGS